MIMMLQKLNRTKESQHVEYTRMMMTFIRKISVGGRFYVLAAELMNLRFFWHLKGNKIVAH